MKTIPRIDFDLTKDTIISNGQFIAADYIDEYCGNIGFYSNSDTLIPISYLIDKNSTVHIAIHEGPEGGKNCIIEHSYNLDETFASHNNLELDTDDCLDRQYPIPLNKQEKEYIELVNRRKSCHICVGLRNPSVVNEQFDSNEIGPWSTWKGDLDAKVVVIGQDWGDEDHFITQEGKCNTANATNRKLEELMQSIGISLERHKVFFTNAILCLKKGGLAGKVKKEWFENCSSNFLKPQIEIIKPDIIITLGEPAYRATTNAFNRKPMSFQDAVNQQEPHMIQSYDHWIKLFPVYHCGQLGLRNRNQELQFKDWKRIEEHITEIYM